VTRARPLDHRWPAALAVGIAVGLAACASSAPERFYTVATAPAAAAASAPAAAGRLIAVEPVQLPELINRPQLVLRTGEHEVRILENERWATPLADDLTQALLGALQQAGAPLDPPAYVLAGSARSQDAALRLAVQVDVLDVGPGPQLRLRAAWVLRDRAHALQGQGVVDRIVPLGSVGSAGSVPTSIVEGYGLAMRTLAQSIAAQSAPASP
jgi:uncharacterized lipoprotein YmbA